MWEWHPWSHRRGCELLLWVGRETLVACGVTVASQLWRERPPVMRPRGLLSPRPEPFSQMWAIPGALLTVWLFVACFVMRSR